MRMPLAVHSRRREDKEFIRDKVGETFFDPQACDR